MRFMMTVLNFELPGLHVRRAYHRNRSHSSIGGRTTGTGAAGRQGVCSVGSQQSHSEPGMALERDWRIQLRLRSVSSTEALGAERGQADSDG